MDRQQPTPILDAALMNPECVDNRTFGRVRRLVGVSIAVCVACAGLAAPAMAGGVVATKVMNTVGFSYRPAGVRRAD